MYEHYLYNGDAEFLIKYAYPIFKDCAAFLFDLLTDVGGKLAALPSTSPENLYYGDNAERLSVCNYTAMDIGILTEFFKAFRQICEALKEEDMMAKSQRALDDLPDYKVSGNRLLEWDEDFTPVEPGHRHFSMLMGLYPYSHLLKDHSLYAQNALYERIGNGGGCSGWSAAWAIALLARMGDGEKAARYIDRLMQNYMHENLFGGHPPSYFQIDANFGFTAAICELLLQDFDGIIRPLAALPGRFANGKISGLKARGGHTVSIEWENCKLKVLTIKAGFERTVKIGVKNAKVFCNGYSAAVQDMEYGMELKLVQGKVYDIFGE
jgi:alpha-L-fucosidase 2